MVDLALGGRVFVSDGLMVQNVRQKEALERAGRNLSQALSGTASSLPDDFITIDLTAAASALGEITGETVQDDLLEAIFSNFCVGK
jgi:tRNA modification GTPase